MGWMSNELFTNNYFFQYQSLKSGIYYLQAQMAKDTVEPKDFSPVDFPVILCYTMLGDRSVETCEAHRRGRTFGSLPLFMGEML